jgi:anaphase-promoting complex subunit 2
LIVRLLVGGPGEDWQPKKKMKDLEQTSLLPSGQDVLAMLVSIYGSTDLFVNEYRAMLAEKLSTKCSFESDSEVATLELLKIRFGEESLHNCEVSF